MRCIVTLTGLAAIVLVSSCGGPPVERKAAEPPAKPDFEARKVDGSYFRFSESAGTVRLVNFWATWCAPCREEIPTLKELETTFGPKGFMIVGISMDDEGAKTAEVVEAFLREYEVDYLNVLGDDGVVEAFGGVLGFPTSILVGRDGDVVKRWPPGLVPKSVLEREIEALLGS